MAIYNKNTWNNGDLITADKLNNLEDGILSIVNTVNTANTSINDISNNVDTLTDTIDTINETVNNVNEQVSNLSLENITETLNNATESINEHRVVINTYTQDISNIKARINRLENHVMLLSQYGDVAIVDHVANTTNITSDKKLVLSNLALDNTNGNIWDINGDGVIVQECDTESIAIRLNSSNEVTLSDNHSTGDSVLVFPFESFNAYAIQVGNPHFLQFPSFNFFAAGKYLKTCKLDKSDIKKLYHESFLIIF